MLNVETNTTQTLAGPITKDPGATYFASLNSLVQLDSTGIVSYLPFNPNDTSANAAAKWSKVVSLANVAPPTNSTTSGTGTGTSSSAKQSGTSKSQTNASSSNDSNDAVAVVAASLLRGIVSAALLACAAVLF